MSSTVVKALSLLNHFSEDRPELGLTELARLSTLDKAAVHRMMGAMMESGLVEQQAESRLYRLGAGVLRLARVRETAFPIHSIVQPILDALREETSETVHASLLSGMALANIGTAESTRGSRVSLQAGEILPLHSTASGLAVLAFAPPSLREKVLALPLTARTTQTVTDPADLEKRINLVARQGYSISDQTNEDDVHGTAAPVFDMSGLACGAVSVSTPSHRMTEDHRNRSIAAVVRAAQQITDLTGGRMPRGYLDRIAQLGERN